MDRLQFSRRELPVFLAGKRKKCRLAIRESQTKARVIPLFERDHALWKDGFEQAGCSAQCLPLDSR